jgi:pimeloyl-ACP methyl ester carboxylesterase
MRRWGFIHLYGLNLVFQRVGQGPPILLLAEETSLWREGLPEGYTFYLLDLPGFGRTGGPSMAPEEMAEYVAAFVVMLNLSWSC